MKNSRRKFSSSFKVKVVLEAIKDQLTLQEIASKFDIHPTQISTWKREFIENSSKAFDSKTKSEEMDKEKSALYSKIGQLQVENDFLKKVLDK
ncbi:transposase [Aquimarina sp. I32.4]|uniref:transposase n=1 Tax=Aquimarina sp. I32.4 TaxID=2053903 RepID=UPI000CDEA198|nr:transposase [Aquimarina sp. I32.4]